MSQIATFLPKYDSDSDYNAAILRNSVPLMVKNRVAAHPINYAIWYEYVAGNNIHLKQAVDEVVSARREFDEQTSMDLYTKHICNASVNSFEKINLDLKQIVDDALNNVERTRSQVSNAEENFEVHSDQLKKISDTSDIKTVMTDIVAETRHLVEISYTLKNQLSEANDEMAKLKVELEKVREIAVTDALTGLLNRRAFDDALIELFSTQRKASHCLMILDLDHFKRVNDSFGHIVGDKVIRFTAGVVKENVQRHHRVARYGGEEMAVIMPDTGLQQAVDIAEKIREILSKNQLKQKDNNRSIGIVTVSIGVTSCQPNDDIESFINRADKALYSAKTGGRNKVVSKF